MPSASPVASAGSPALEAGLAALLKDTSPFKDRLEDLLFELPADESDALMMLLKESRGAWAMLLERAEGQVLFCGNALSGTPVALASLGLTVEVSKALHENDRSATGFLAPEQFEAAANQFFAEPEASVQGWERAVDAQTRIVAAVEAVMAAPARGSALAGGTLEGSTLLVGHGGVGTLLYCHYAGVGIDRQFDQPPGGGGNYLTISWPERQMLHPWRPMEFPPDTIFDSKTAIG